MRLSSEIEENRELFETTYCSAASMMTLWLSRSSDPLVHHGRHFGRTVHAMCNVQALIINSLLLGDDGEVAEEMLTVQFVSDSFLKSRPLICNLGKERSFVFSSNCYILSPA